MPQLDNLYTQILDLDSLDVYLETPVNDESYFSVRGLPEQIGYGKHFFTLTYKDPPNSPLLATNSSIVFEFVDSNGTVVFSELADIPDTSGAATGYIWIKEDPLRTAENIFDGELTMYVVGTLDGVPTEYQNIRNLRSSFTFEIRKNKPNLSPIMLYDPDGVVASSSFTETLEADLSRGINDITYNRGYINVSASHLQTQGGKIKFAELSYLESGSRSGDFTLLNTFELENDTARFEVNRSGSQGINPISTTFKAPIPKEIRRDTPVKFKLRYLDENKTPAQYYDENRLNEQIVITSSEIVVNGSPQIIERSDNLLRGSMFTGNAVGKGFEQSGRSSAYIKSVDYTGFISASTHIGKSGIMMFSGSVLTGSGDEYQGVGLELVGDSESFFRFRSNPSVLDIKTREFFVGTQNTQFISASQGQIEISSSRFHLTRDGDVFYSGSVDASGGRIGGFEISSSRIQSTNRDLILMADGRISASAILLASSSFQLDFNNMSRFGSDGFQSFVMADDTGVRIQTSDFNLNTARFIISSSDVGVMAMGSTPPTAFNSGKGIYMSGDGEFLAGDSNGERMQFNGFNLVLSSSAFFLGNQDSFMSGSQGKILISGSDIGIQTPRFFFGDASKFISGSLGNLEISSSRFHLSRDGNVKLIGRIEAESGFLGGFGITNDAITGSNIIMSGSPQIGGTDHPTFMFISSSNFNLKENGDMTASAILFSGGQIGGFDLSDDLFNSKNNKLILKSNGQITGSEVQFTGGKIAAFNLSNDALFTDSFFISASATNDDLFISASSFNVSAKGVVTASALSLTGGDVAGLSVAEGTISVGDILKLKDSGQITASEAQLTGKITATSGQIAGWSIVGDTLVGNNATLDGAGAALFKSDQGPGSDTGAALDQLRNEYYIDFTPTGSSSSNFFIKMGPNFMVDKDGILIASGATFIGTITASAGLIGGFSSDDHSLRGSNFFISGAASGNERFISTSNFNVKASGNITGSQVLFTGGTIGGFELSSTQINSTNDNLILKSSGQISASNAQIQGKITAESGTIGGFNIGTDLDSTAGTLKLKGATGQITASDAQITGKITAQTGTIGGFNIGADLDSTSGTLKLKGASGQITASDAQISGKVTATSGQIAGFTIDGNTLTATNFNLDASGKRITLGNGNNIFIADGDEGIQLGHATFADAPFHVTTGGVLKATSGTIGGFTLSSNELTATNFELNPSQKRITLGSSNDIFIADGDEGIQLGHATFNSAPFSVTTAGFVKSTTGEIGGFRINSSEITSSNDALILRSRGEITGSQVLFTGGRVAGFTLSGDTLTANNFLLDAGNQKMTLGSGNEIFIADGDVGINLGNSSFASSPFSVTKTGVLKAISGTIGGWNLGSDRIFSTNINITSAGTIETSDFTSGVKGWRISALNNGTAEFENAVIRGTMKTAVFEKETVNAVGGQLYVANSTVLSGSGTISASFNTMSVDNVSGFTGSYGGAGEILSLKKITPTGFSTEYVLVQSASRKDPSSDTDFSGQLFVVRGYSGSIQSDSSSLGDNPNPAQDYEPGQVIVSTGISGSGYIRINANPTDVTTPYIDIVERTGSAIYDVELKARLGDLSGLSSAKVGTQGGFGLFTERAFLTKDVTVGTLGTEHITIDATSLKFLDNETTMAELRGTTWTLGGAHGTTDDAIVMSPDNGVKIFDNSNNFVTVDSTGLTVTQSGAGVAQFASTTTIGNTSTEHVELTSTSLKLKDGSTTRLSMDSSGMQIGSVSNGITLDSSGNATFNGTITIGSSLAASISGSAANAIAGVAASASAAQSTADTGVANAATAQSTANTGVANAATAQSTANSANTAASNASTLASNLSAGAVASASAAQTAAESTAAALSAGAVASASAAQVAAEATATALTAGAVASSSAAQNAIDAMETQVVLSSAGMDLRNNSNVNVATFGTTTKFFDGVDDEDANRKLQLNADGVFVFGNSTDTYAYLRQSGVQIVSASIERANFAATTTIGNTATEHLELTSTTLKLKDGSTTRLSMDSSGMQIGSVGNGITLDASGNATFNGEITIGASLAASISGSIAGQTGSLDSAISTAQSTADTGVSNAATAQSTANSANTAAGNAQSTADSANTAASNAQTSANNASTLASNLSAGAVASASAAQTAAETTAAALSAGAVASASAAGAGAVASASAAQAAAELHSSNLAAGARASASAASAEASAAQNAIDTMETQVVLSSAGMDLRNNSNINVATFGTTTKFFDGSGHADANRKLQLNADGIFAFGDDTNTFTKVFNKGIQIVKDNVDLGFFGSTVRVGALNQQHVSMSSAGVTFMNSGTKTGFISGDGATIGTTSNAHISASTTDVHIIKDANNKAVISADGLKITQGGNEVADFGSTVVIGEVGASKSNVQITSGAINLRSNTTNKMVLGADGSITIGNDFSVDSSGNASFAGTLSIGSLPAGTVSGSAQLASAISGSIAGQTGSLDSAISTAQSTANTGVSNAATAQSTANSAQSTANTANTAATAMATQVVLDSNGMSLKNQAANLTLASFGTTVTIGEVANSKSRMFLDSDSLDLIIRDGAGSDTTHASFGATTTVGNTSTEHVKITSSGLELKDGSTVRLTMDSSGISMGDQFSVDSSGNASFSGTLSIGSLPAGTVSGSAQLASAISGSIAGQTGSLDSAISTAQSTADTGVSNAATAQGTANSAQSTANTANATATTLTNSSASMAAAVQITSVGMNILNSSGNKLAEYGSNVFVGLQNAEHVKISSDGLELKDNTTTLGKFASTTTIGNTSTEHVEITNSSLKLKDGTTENVSISGTTVTIGSDSNNRVEITPTSMQIGSTGGGITMDSSGNATFNGTIVIGASLAASISGSSATAVAGAVGSASAADTAATNAQNAADAAQGTANSANATATTLTNSSASMAAAVQLTPTGMNILNGSGATLAEYGATVTIGQDANDKSRMVLGADSLDLIVDSGGTDTNFASFGAISRIGDVANEHISMSSTGVTVKDGGTQLANFASTTTVGSTSTEHVEITSTSFKLKDGSTERLVMNSSGIAMGSNFSVDASGNVTMAGAVTANTGTIGGFNIGTDLDASSGTLKLKGANGQITASAALLTGGDIGGFLLESDQLVSRVNPNHPTAERTAIMVDSGQGANYTYDGNDASGIVFGGKKTGRNFSLSNAAKETGSFFVISDIGGSDQGMNFRMGVKDTFFQISAVSDDPNGILQISSSNFSIDSSGNTTMRGTIEAEGGSIGGFTINGNELTGSSGAILSTAATGQRVKISGTDNSIKFFEPGNNELMDLGIISTVDFGSGNRTDFYGISLAGSAVSSKINSVAKISINNADAKPAGAVTTNSYGSGFTNIFSKINLGTGTDILRGRPAIYGEFESELTSNSATTGLASGVTGMVKEHNNGYWDMSAGVVGVSSLESANMDSSEGGGVPDGQYGVVSVGNSYVKGVLTTTGNIVVGGTVDGRDVATDGSKLDGIEAGANVTDAANVQSAGALMDSECEDVNALKDIDQDLTTGASPEFSDLTISDDLFVNDFARIDALRVGTTSTDPGDGNLYVENDLTVAGKIFQGTSDTVFFEAQATGGTTVAHNTYTKVEYNNEGVDLGGDYSTVYDRFTAPVNGVYFFRAQFLWDNASNWDAGDNPIIALSVNDSDGSDGRFMIRTGNFTEFFSMQTTAILKLDQGDTVHVDAYQNTGTTLYIYDGGGEGAYNQFMGTLLHALT